MGWELRFSASQFGPGPRAHPRTKKAFKTRPPLHSGPNGNAGPGVSGKLRRTHYVGRKATWAPPPAPNFPTSTTSARLQPLRSESAPQFSNTVCCGVPDLKSMTAALGTFAPQWLLIRSSCEYPRLRKSPATITSSGVFQPLNHDEAPAASRYSCWAVPVE